MRVNVEQVSKSQPDLLEMFTQLTDIGLRTQTEQRHGIFMAEGELTIRRALAAGHRMIAVMAQARWLDSLSDCIPGSAVVIEDDQERLSQVTGFVIHRGAMAAFERPEPLSSLELLSRGGRFLFLEGLVNHTNVGAIFRSAAAMRMSGILIGPECADPLYRRAIRTSMGAVFSLPWARISWEEFDAQTSGMELVALTPEIGSVDIREWVPSENLLLMVGTEGEGLSRVALERASVRVRIPMAPGIDSLNAAAATAVACYEINRGIR